MSFERGTLLLQSGRHDMAEKEFRAVLVLEPNNARAHAMISFCMLRRNAYAEATDEAKQAIQLQPNSHFGYSALALVLNERELLKEATDAINRAIQLDPGNSNHYGRLAEIRFKQRNWSGALEAADRGLQLDPESHICVNARGMSLVKLGRRDDAGATLMGALAKDPHNAVTHANQGWALLHKHDHRAAMEHFREALRIDSELQWAKAGMVEAIKAKNPIYGLMLRYFLFMSRLKYRAQWGIIVGAWLGYHVLSVLMAAYPALRPVTLPLIIAYFLFVLMSWMATPFFNLLLRLNRFGRFALSRDQILASNWLCGCLAGGILLFTIGAFTDFRLIVVGIMLAALSLPITTIYRRSRGKPRHILMGYTACVSLLGVATCISMFFSTPRESLKLDEVSANLIVGFFFGVVMTSWIANAVLMLRAKR
jgi:tetratricopeptide (TPR) repeat protein